MVNAPLRLTPTYTIVETEPGLENLTLNATDRFGVDWIVGEELGWSDAAPVRLATADREDADGGYSGPVYRNPRLISLKGIALCPSRVVMLEAKERLRGSGDRGAEAAQFVITEEHLPFNPRCTWVKHATEVRIRDVNSHAFEWELSLRADDPLRYAETESSIITAPLVPVGGMTFDLTFNFDFGTGGLATGSDTANNVGNAYTYPRFRVAGPITAPTVTNLTTDRRISAPTLSLNEGETLTADLGRRQFEVNGASRYDALTTSSTWWGLKPGPNKIQFTAAAHVTDAQLTLTWRSAWK